MEPNPSYSGSFLSGTACLNQTAPVDKNGEPLNLFGQLDFAQLHVCDDSRPEMPTSGVIRVFISPHYKQFREKDSGWFKILFSEVADSSISWTEALQIRLLARTTAYLPINFEKRCAQSDHNQTGENGFPTRMSNFVSTFNEHFVGTDYILGEPSNDAMESRVIAAFHANGISYDNKRRNDSCYRHLLEDAASWRVLWKSGRVSLVFPDEKRELYICIRSDDLQNGDFGKCRPVFL
jgi:Domain of unknown function (DUF1963).